MRVQADATQVRWLVLDADGTLTDGGIQIDSHGVESKRFCVRDGFAMRAWMASGRHLAVITGRGDLSLRHRLADLEVTRVVSASGPKGPVIEALMQQEGLLPKQVAAMGDDLPDLPMLRRVGYPMAVANAAPELLEVAAWTSRARGGDGAVREAVEHLMRAADVWRSVVERHA